MTRKNTDAEATYRPDRRRMLKLFGALGVSGIAGCGGDGDGSTPTRTDVPTGRSTPTEKKTDTPTPTEEPTPTETPTRTGTPEPGASEVVDEPPENFEEFKSTVAAISDPGNFPSSAKSPYAAFEESLSDVDPTPEWFRDAKFGIDFHWGVYSVPAFGSEWYPHNIYKKNHYMKSYHVDTYGPPDEYTYHDLVSKFTAENFDADRWLDLFETAGARFVGPVAEHHDGWSNWDSNINPYNAAAMGPERDLTGELAEATRERDLRFMTSFHHARNGAPFDEEDFERTDPTGAQSGTHYEYAYDNYPSVTEGWPNRAMYANMHTDVFVDSFVAKVIEVVDNYRPDLIWFDNAVESIPDADIYTMLAYCYNLAESEDRDVVVTRKQQDLPISMSVEDYEKGRPASLQDQAWLTDTTLSKGSWSYVEGQSYKSTGQVVRTLIDIVSKNGNMLLNVSPKADGTIPEDQRSRLEGVGAWLQTHDEAVYGTRPWDVFGEGPTRLDSGGHFVGSVNYTSEDVRYTQSKDGETLYAHVLGWPGGGDLILEAVEMADPDAGTATLIDHGEVEVATDGQNRATVTVPALDESERPSDHAVVFALDGFDLTANENAGHT